MGIPSICFVGPNGKSMSLSQDTHILSKVQSAARHFLNTCTLRDMSPERSFDSSEFSDEGMARFNAMTQHLGVVIGSGISTEQEWTDFLHESSRRPSCQTAHGAVIVRVCFDDQLWPDVQQTGSLEHSVSPKL